MPGPAVVQSKGGSVAGASTLTLTLTSGTTAGNCLVVAIGIGAVAGTVSTVKLGTVSLAKAKAAANSSAEPADCEWWILPNIAGGQTSVPITASSTTDICAVAYEVSNLALTSPVDQTQSNTSNTTGSTWTSNASGTTAQASEIEFGAVMAVTNGTFTGPGGWTNTSQTAGTLAKLVCGYQVVSSTGTATYSGTQSGDTDNWGWSAVVITLKAAGGASGAPLMMVFP